ncbi:MAG: Secretion system C-terminal sorting domain [Bacteroidota bacterium]
MKYIQKHGWRRGNDGAFVYSIANNNSYRISSDSLENAAISVSAFPNPSNSSFNLQVTSKDDQRVHVSIYDLQGRSVGTMTTTTTTTTTPTPNQNLVFGNDLATGMYQVEVKQGATVKTMRIVKY